MFTYGFWQETAQRCVRTFAQTVISLIGVSSFSVWSLDWQNIAGVGLGASFVSLLMSLDRSTNSTVVEVEKVVEKIVEVPVVESPNEHSAGDSLR